MESDLSSLVTERLELLTTAALRVEAEHRLWVTGEKRSGDDFWLALEDGLFPLLQADASNQDTKGES